MIRIFFSAALLLLVLFSSCDLFNSDEIALKPTEKFKVDAFNDNLKTQLGIQWDGYAYLINQDGQLKYWDTLGYWVKDRTKADITTPIYGASVNKFVTAVAVLKALEQNPGTNLDKSISGYLPPSWGGDDEEDLSAFIKGVTIRELLTHTSGIPGPNATTWDSDYATLKNIAQNGVGAPASGYAYSNANFGFLRIYIASLNGASYWGDDSQMEQQAISLFKSFMTNEIFDLAGEGGNGIEPVTDPSNALYYAWGNTAPGWQIGDRSVNLGSGGYYYAPVELAKFLAYVNHSEKIINASSRETLYENFFGLTDGSAPPVSVNGVHGWYYAKGGSLIDNNGRGVRNVIMIFPEGVEVVFMANCRGGALDNSGLNNGIITAYDASWE